jgi:disulfide bond formation protein DsbB
MYMAIRHSSLHLARDVGQGFAGAFFGAHTYIWAWFIHAVVLAVLGKLLIMLREDSVETGSRELTPTGRFAVGLFVVVIGANALQAFTTTGPPPFMGQADPLRFSLNPSHWVWMYNDELSGAVSLRGRWTIPEPDPARVEVPADPAGGPLADLPTLSIDRWEEIAAPMDGTVTGLAYDAGPDGVGDGSAPTGRFLAVTDAWSVYVLDGSLTRVEHGVTLDRHFAVELTRLAGATFIGDTLMAMSSNKSYALLHPDPEADEGYEWRHFLETSGGVSEVRRSRLATVRARQHYILSAAYDADADEVVTVSVPSARHPRMVVSRFDRSDLMLSSEFLPSMGEGLALRGPERTLAEYVVTGATVEERVLYAVSAAYSTVLAIDLASRSVVAAYAVPGLEQPVGLTVRGGEWLIAQADGRVAVVEIPESTDAVGDEGAGVPGPQAFPSDDRVRAGGTATTPSG